MKKLEGKKVFVFGLGKSGAAVALLMAGKGAKVIVWDDDIGQIEAFFQQSRYDRRLSAVVAPKSAVEAAAELGGCETMVLSPGIPLEHELVAEAGSRSIVVMSELEAAYRYCKAKIVAVTGTNGKSTTTDLIGKILEEAGRPAVVAGNIGTPFSAVLDEANRAGTVVLEVSSFQLDTIEMFKADVAVILNVTPDHLDRYGDSFERYAAAKKRILNRADAKTVFVYNREDPVCLDMSRGFVGRKAPFSSARRLEEGVYHESGVIFVAEGGVVEEVIARGDFGPKGIHNLENALAAVAAAASLGVRGESVRRALRSYRALPHRMELVRIVNGVAYVNDSKATNVDAAVKSIDSIEGRVIVILGGQDKNGDFATLYPALTKVKLAVLLGRARAKIAAALAGRCDIVEVSDMEEAVQKASASALPGDTVILAPACASFDMFKDYKERGEVFRNCVKKLAA